MIQQLFAQTQSPSGPAPGPAQSILGSPIIMIVGLFIIFYFMMLRPQKKREQTHKKFLEGLKKGDEVVTASGIFGRVAGVAEQVVTLEVSQNVKIRVSKSTIAGNQPTSQTTGAAT